jgi:hypothetical protein
MRLVRGSVEGSAIIHTGRENEQSSGAFHMALSMQGPLQLAPPHERSAGLSRKASTVCEAAALARSVDGMNLRAPGLPRPGAFFCLTNMLMYEIITSVNKERMVIRDLYAPSWTENGQSVTSKGNHKHPSSERTKDSDINHAVRKAMEKVGLK